MVDQFPQLPRRIILWGAFGQALLVKDVADHYGSEITAVFTDANDVKSPFSGIPIYHGWNHFYNWADGRDLSRTGVAISLNMNGALRLEYHNRFVEMGLQPVTLVHPSAVIANDASIGAGSQIMAGVILGPKAEVGKQCIVNAKVSIDHESILEDGVEISPGATLCGLVRVGSCAWIAAGATVLPMMTIGENAIVGAGAVVNKNVPPGTTVAGIPARPLQRK